MIPKKAVFSVVIYSLRMTKTSDGDAGNLALSHLFYPPMWFYRQVA
ncbi:hypothetical protein IMCC14465_13370 [alpha proteobacterium IMCC14465]|uniref:Uncharacterized protein n=1 Tax=alpha proteobacterium IMCC14465 TaxID=1220535 RepID=J9DI34_9PROT|nr:hypothetical protein IMCC14465_13370 [alpha proteobacterium IMCC14465]